METKCYNNKVYLDNYIDVEQIYLDKISPDTITHDYLSQFFRNNIFELSFVFQSDFRNTKYLRDYLFYILDIIGVDSIWKNRFVLIIDELNNNAIEYGSNSQSENIFSIMCVKTQNDIEITIEVEDSGDGKSPKKSEEMESMRIQRIEWWFENHHSIRGRGLFLIITKLVDQLYFKDSQKGGLIVGVKKRIQTKKA